MRRFELSEGTSNKFWEVDVEGNALTVRFGRIGTNGQTQTKEFASAEKATAEHDKLVKEKTKKGYAEVAASGTLAAVAPKPAPTPTPSPTPSPSPNPPQTPSPNPNPPSTPNPPPRSVIDSVAWTDSALRAIAPIRGSSLVTPRAPDARATYATIRKAAQGYDALLAKGLKRPNADRDKITAVRALFAETSAPEKLDLETQAAAFALIGKPLSWNDDDRSADFVRFWIAAEGAAFAFRAYARSSELATSAKHDDHVAVLTAGADAGEQEWWRVRGEPPWRALRLADVLASEAEHAELVALASELRAKSSVPARAGFAAALAHPAWCKADADVAIGTPTPHGLPAWFWPLLLGLESIDDVKAAIARTSPHVWTVVAGVDAIRFDVVARFGPSAAELLVPLVKEAGVGGADRVRSLAEAVALIVTDEVTELFLGSLGSKELRPIAAEYLTAHPELSFERLAHVATQKGANGDTAKSLLRPIVASHPELARKIKDALAPAARAVLDSLESAANVAEADPSELPRVLREPPWTTKKKLAPPRVVTGLTPLAFEEKIDWRPGERDKLGAREGWLAESKDKKTLDKVRAVSASAPAPNERSWNMQNASILAQLPVADLLALAPSLDLGRFNWSYYGVADVLLARHELPILDFVLRFAREVDGVTGAEVLARVDSPRVATHMADALVRLKKGKPHAIDWLTHHPEAAAIGLVPAAVGPAGKARELAETALRFVARAHRDVVERIAKRFGADAESAVRDVLDFDPLFTFPSKLPKMPAFWNAGAVTPPLLAGRAKALPVAAVDALGTMLAFSTIEDPYPGIAEVKEACDARSLAEFAWDLFQAWLVAGAPSKEQWAFLAMAHFGDDECARKLTPLVRAWPGEAAHARAVTGLDVLARIGTDVALMHLHGIAQKLKFKGLQEKAREKIDQIAEARGLSAEELADRLVPDLGLDDDGSLALDFGPRKFRVVFDETLKPAVLDEAGKRVPDLPKPKQSDDAEKSKAATETWKALKKDAKTIAGSQLLRLEVAMCTQRRWSVDVYRQFLLEHPLLFHIVRRLVWGVYDRAGKLASTFRVAEDRSLASAKDDAYDLPDGAEVGIVHRLELDDAQAASWGQVFGDYEILQPFAQLSREIATPTEKEKAATKLERVVGLTVPTGKVLGLDHRGWRRGPPQDGGVVCWYEKPLGGERVAWLDLDPGIFTGMVSEAPEQKLGGVTIAKGGDGWRPEKQIPLGEIGPIAFSELLRDLESLRG
ncbi:MAG TPA: DUF4132 domain-containing protein [Polyangiaceae bacterium]|jgi:predicted DNA-binding WGR domain protein